MQEQITKDTLINEMLEKHPEIAEILMAYGLHCVNCHFSEFDTLEDGAMVHGMSDEDVELMIRDANKIMKEKIKKV
ncbi:MAG: DUF1858 domain-containing protein [Nanoarchaeota archaeon]|nr:DUF1858 domain-containing protein [Nanoarchaeota archaeon]